MDWSRHESLSAQWCASSRAYTAAINAYILRCNRGEDAGPPPEDDRGPLVDAVLAVVREANAALRTTGERDVIRELRRRFPPAHDPFVPYIKQHATHAYQATWDEGETVFATLGDPGLRRELTRIEIDGKVSFSGKVALLVRSPRRDSVLMAFHDRLELMLGRGKPRTFHVPPTALAEKSTDGVAVERPPGYLDAAILPDGRGALLVMRHGVFLCDEHGAKRLFPDEATVEADLREYGYCDFPMIHAALSPDGTLVAAGWQDSPHVVLTLDGSRVASFGPASEYAHHATFTPDGKTVLASSCHMTRGVTIAVALDSIRGLELPKDDERSDPRFQTIERGFTLTSSCFLGDLFIVGDRNGYLRAYTLEGDYRWEHFCGSSVFGIDVAPDGKRLVVSTAAGYVQILELDTGSPDPFQIGTATHRELVRFMFWRGDNVLRW